MYICVLQCIVHMLSLLYLNVIFTFPEMYGAAGGQQGRERRSSERSYPFIGRYPYNLRRSQTELERGMQLESENRIKEEGERSVQRSEIPCKGTS